MMRRGRHPVPKREGLAPLIVYGISIRLLPLIASIFRERQLSLGIVLPGEVK